MFSDGGERGRREEVVCGKGQRWVLPVWGHMGNPSHVDSQLAKHTGEGLGSGLNSGDKFPP